MRGASAARARAVRRGATRAASNAGARARARARENPRTAVERTTLRYDGHARVDGDAAGRAQDHSAVDKEFAENVGVRFFVPEQMFVEGEAWK